MSSRTYTKLARGDSWAVIYFYDPTSPHARKALKWTNGDPVQIRWPDGTESEEIILHRRFTGRYSDMGNQREAAYSLAGFEVDVHGILTWFALDSVEVHIPHG
jgi:hypothetical protein